MQKVNPRPRKMLKKKEEYLQVNVSKDKNRYSIYYPTKNSQELQAYKTMNKKSIEINNTQPVRALNTISQLSRPVYRRISYHQKNATTTSKRYEDEEQNEGRGKASSYSKKEQIMSQLGRTSILNRSSNPSSNSNQKIRSGNLTKQLSPYQLYKQPRSSLSQHYDPTLETSLHKRRQSYIEEKNGSLKIAKEYYKSNNYEKCCEFLRKYLRGNLGGDTIEAYYLLGMSLINKGEHKQGIEALQKVIQLSPSYKKTVYLIMALANKKLNQYHEAIEILTKGLTLFPDYYDLLIYRGKMYLKEEKFDRSRDDFGKAIEMNRHKGFAYLGKGTCEINLKMIDQAVRTFSEGIQTDLAHVCYQKRGICYYQQHNFVQALKDLEQASMYDSYFSSAVHYYKGMIYYKQKDTTESLLCFEQCLKCDNNRELVTLAIQMMLKIKIEDKDFYEAYHLINRAENVDVQKNAIAQWKLFLEASLFLMKKKYKDALETYQTLQKKELYQFSYNQITKQSHKERFKFIKPLIHLYKAFGYLSESQPEIALFQYECHTSVCKSMHVSTQNLSKRYNTLIVLASKSFPNNITDHLIQAAQLIPTKPEPYLFLAFDQMHQTLQLADSQQRHHSINQIIQNLTTGISHLPQLSNNHISSFYYFRAILQLYQQDFSKAVSDVDKAIEKSEDNIPKYFYLRGLIFACFGNFSQAVQDFSVAINLDEKYAKPYLQRAKCLQIEGNSNEAFIDLQKYITLAPEDPYIHKYAGFLLFQNCAYEDCLSAFSHGSDLPNDQELILTKAKCNFLLGHYDVALQYFQSYKERSHSTVFETDVEIIKICHQISAGFQNGYTLDNMIERLNHIEKDFKDQDSKIFKIRDLHQIKGSIYLIRGEYVIALEEFSKTLDFFRVQKQREFQKNLVEDPNQFEEEWSEIQIKFNLSLCHLCKQEYDTAYELVSEFAQSTEKGKNWEKYVQLIEELLMEKSIDRTVSLDTFEQNIRISKLWPKITLPNTRISLSMALSYPFVEPPEMMPEFDEELFSEFTMLKVEPKPEAPWINRNHSGLVFTPNIQVYDNLELSMTTKKNDDDYENEHNKPTSEIQQSISLSNSEFQLPTEDLKKKFKLDSLVEMKLNKILNK